jgi:hypothetical protein
MYGEYFLYEESDWELFRSKVEEWQKRSNTLVSMRKSSMFDNIFTFLTNGTISLEDLDGFSEKLVSDLKELLKIYNYNMNNV